MDWRTVPHGNPGRYWHATVQHFSKRVQNSECCACRWPSLGCVCLPRRGRDDFRGIPYAHGQAEPWQAARRARARNRRRMSLKIQRDDHGSLSRRDARVLDPYATLSTRGRSHSHYRRHSMKVLPSLQPIAEEITTRFGSRLKGLQIAQANEVYFDANIDLIAGFCGHLYKRWNARLVSVFADDVRKEHGVFHLYYIYALDAAHGFLILRVPVPPDRPELPSLTNAVPAVNWQEREIQDLFGLKLIGHPNPRRCALHDDWPDVHPLRKDFDLRTQLPPFSGPRHDFRVVEGEGVFQVPVGPVHAG